MYVFWAVTLGFGTWGVAVVYLFTPALRHFRDARQEDVAQRDTLTDLPVAARADGLALLQAADQHRRARNSHLADAVGWSAVAIPVYVLGIGFLRIGFSAGETAALVFGTLFLAAASGLAIDLVRHWHSFSHAGRGSRELALSRLHYAGIVLGLFAGCMILAFGL